MPSRGLHVGLISQERINGVNLTLNQNLQKASD